MKSRSLDFARDFGCGAPASLTPAKRLKLELAKVSGAGTDGGGLDLDAENVWAVGDADIVGGGVAPGLGDGVSVLEGAGHEA